MEPKREPEEEGPPMLPEAPDKENDSADSSPLSSPPPSDEDPETPTTLPSTPSPSKKRKLVVLKGEFSSDSEDDIPLSQLRLNSSSARKQNKKVTIDETEAISEEQQISNELVLYDAEAEDNLVQDNAVTISRRGPPSNGRAVGRKLIPWHRPRMVEKLLLMILYECQRAGLPISWDLIIHRLSPGSSGQSGLQFVMKLRDQLIVEGHLVPPPLGRLGAPGPDFTRGFIRNRLQPDPHAIRKVNWSEHIEDRRESLVEHDVIRGSGNYRRLQAMIARGELPDDEPLPTKRGGQKKTSPDGKATRDTLSKARKADKKKSRAPLPEGCSRFLGSAGDTTDDDDYECPPWNPPRMPREMRRSLVPTRIDSRGNYVSSDEEEPSPAPPRRSGRRNQTAVVTLSLSSENLARFPPGESRVRARSTLATPDRVAQAFGGSNYTTPPASEVAGVFGGSVDSVNFWGTANDDQPAEGADMLSRAVGSPLQGRRRDRAAHNRQARLQANGSDEDRMQSMVDRFPSLATLAEFPIPPIPMTFTSNRTTESASSLPVESPTPLRANQADFIMNDQYLQDLACYGDETPRANNRSQAVLAPPDSLDAAAEYRNTRLFDGDETPRASRSQPLSAPQNPYEATAGSGSSQLVTDPFIDLPSLGYSFERFQNFTGGYENSASAAAVTTSDSQQLSDPFENFPSPSFSFNRFQDFTGQPEEEEDLYSLPEGPSQAPRRQLSQNPGEAATGQQNQSTELPYNPNDFSPITEAELLAMRTPVGGNEPAPYDDFILFDGMPSPPPAQPRNRDRSPSPERKPPVYRY